MVSLSCLAVMHYHSQNSMPSSIYLPCSVISSFNGMPFSCIIKFYISIFLWLYSLFLREKERENQLGFEPKMCDIRITPIAIVTNVKVMGSTPPIIINRNMLNSNPCWHKAMEDHKVMTNSTFPLSSNENKKQGLHGSGHTTFMIKYLWMIYMGPTMLP
mgnify:CR=1 FL=1